MNELETHVNAIIASLAAEPGRKLQIRRELITHLHDALAEEESHARTTDDAIDVALRRLGDPRQIQRELQAAIPFSDILGSAFRRSLLCLALLIFVSLPYLLVGTFDSEMPETGSSALLETTEFFRLQAAPLFAAQCVVAANVFLGSLLHYWFRVRSPIASRPILERSVCAVVAAVVVLATGAMLSLLTTGGIIQSWEFCVRWAWIALAVSLAVPIVIPLARQEINRYRHWHHLCSILTSD